MIHYCNIRKHSSETVLQLIYNVNSTTIGRTLKSKTLLTNVQDNLKQISLFA